MLFFGVQTYSPLSLTFKSQDFSDSASNPPRPDVVAADVAEKKPPLARWADAGQKQLRFKHDKQNWVGWLFVYWDVYGFVVVYPFFNLNLET